MTYRASEIQPTNNISILMKGPFGFGKTLAACSFAVFGPVWLAYFDKKVPIEIPNFFKKIGREDLLDNIHIDTYSSSNPHEYLNQLIKFQIDGCPYIAGITDSVTNLTSSAVNWSLAFRDGNKKRRRGEGEPEIIPEFDEYKVETSLTSQALDICKNLDWFNIWTAHPLPALEVKGSGNSIVVNKVTHIVSYGQKVGAMVPGAFNEIYHFARENDYSTSPTTVKRVVLTDMLGDDYAKTSYNNMPSKFDITNKLFAEVWKDLIDKSALDKVISAKGKEIKNETVGGSNTSWVNPWKK